MEKLLIWDIDGTLIHCKGVGRKAMDAAFEQCHGISGGFDGVDMAGGLDAVIVRRAYEKHGIPLEDIERFYEVYGKQLQHQLEVHRPTVHPGVHEVLETTHVSGRILNVVGTGNCEIGAKLKLDFTDLQTYFTLGGYGNDHETRPALVRAVIDSAEAYLGRTIEKEDIYVIGDTPNDIRSGKANGIRTVAVLTGYCSEDRLLACEPDIVLASLADAAAFYRAIEWQL